MADRQYGSPTFADAIATLLRQARRQRHMTQADVSERTGGAITKPALANYEGGHRSLRIDIFWQLTQALEIDAGEIFAAAERMVAAANGTTDAPLVVRIAGIEASADPRLDPVRRWFHMRAVSESGGRRSPRALKAAREATVTLEAPAVAALAQLMGVEPDACRKILQQASDAVIDEEVQV